MQPPNIYDALAAVLSYPGEDYPARVQEAVLAAPAELAPQLQTFAMGLAGQSTLELQELYTVTFDLNPVCSLELGWHLFGENYDRGLLLVRLRGLLRQYGIAESVELPDHLSHALLLLGRMDEDARREFAIAIVLPAIGKMLDAFREKQNPYEKVLTALKTELRSLCPGVPIFIPQQEPVLRILE
jgi:nitrate reductase molybdenum cofactor assembly chaperone NarJ/NarW